MPRWRGGRVFAMTVLALALLGTGGFAYRAPIPSASPEQLERKVYNKCPLERMGRLARTAANRYSRDVQNCAPRPCHNPPFFQPERSSRDRPRICGRSSGRAFAG
jgi:hypothetical protein